MLQIRLKRLTEVELRVAPDQVSDQALRQAAAKSLGVDQVADLRVLRRSIDARHGRVWVIVRVAISLDGPLEHSPHPHLTLPDVSQTPIEVAVVGTGPAGLFAALELTRAGIRCVLLERGSDVRGRRPHLAQLNREGVLNTESNYCFGEGGAGTYSDGKLYTRARKRGPIKAVLDDLVACGAPDSILVDARPHIGTNRLPQVIETLRRALVEAGVDVRFNTRVDDLVVKQGRIAGLRLADDTVIEVPRVVLATGHSARDIYQMLDRLGVAIEAKPFALGVRIEHPQPVIDQIQYGRWAGTPRLGAASYSLKRTVDGTGVYSFCMCPGGFIVAAATEQGGVVVNGMSPSARNSRYANSGMVVTVGPTIFGEGALAGIAYQRRLEQAAFSNGGGLFKAPAQRLDDFLDGRISTNLPDCSYRPGLVSVELREVLPPELSGPLIDALRHFGKRMRGFLTHEAVLVGVESRSSAPVRIPRDRSLQSPTHPGLYPCGEGAGYAGGIISAALDGRRVAHAIAGCVDPSVPAA